MIMLRSKCNHSVKAVVRMVSIFGKMMMASSGRYSHEIRREWDREFPSCNCSVHGTRVNQISELGCGWGGLSANLRAPSESLWLHLSVEVGLQINALNAGR